MLSMSKVDLVNPICTYSFRLQQNWRNHLRNSNLIGRHNTKPTTLISQLKWPLNWWVSRPPSNCEKYLNKFDLVICCWDFLRPPTKHNEVKSFFKSHLNFIHLWFHKIWRIPGYFVNGYCQLVGCCGICCLVL